MFDDRFGKIYDLFMTYENIICEQLFKIRNFVRLKYFIKGCLPSKSYLTSKVFFHQRTSFIVVPNVL